jgi:hypothetical protein
MDEVEDLVLDIAWRDYDICFNDKTVLENKANIVLVVDGVLIGLILTTFNSINKQFGIIAFILLILSTLFCLIALYLRDYKYLEAMKTWADFENDQITDFPQQAKRNIFATIDNMVKFNRTNYDKVAFWIKLALIFSFISIIFVAISIITNQELFINGLNIFFTEIIKN